MSYTDFIYNSYTPSMTVKKIGIVKDILHFKSIENHPSSTIRELSMFDLNENKILQNTPNLITITEKPSCIYDRTNTTTCKVPDYSTGQLDSQQTCSIGLANGTCKGQCIGKHIKYGESTNDDNGDWGVYTKYGNIEDPDKWGWVQCNYEYDFSNYDNTKQTILISWIREIYRTFSANTPKNIWLGPLGRKNNDWQAYNFYKTNNDKKEFNTLLDAKAEAEQNNDSNGIMVNDNDTKYQLRWGVGVEGSDSAGFGYRVFSRKINIDNIVDLFRLNNIVYAPIIDMFNMMYNTGYYTNNKQLNSFQYNCKFLQSNNFVKWKRDYLSSWFNLCKQLYIESFPDNIQNIIESVISLPSVEKIDNEITTFNISLQISYPQLQSYNKSDNKDLFISNLLINLFQDNQGKLLINRRQVDISNISVINSSITNYTIINLETLRLFTIPPGQFPTNSAYDFFTTATITAKISTWSPITVIYFASKGITFSDISGLQIYNNCKVYPLSSYQYDCTTITSNCIEKIRTFCPTKYIPPTSVGSISLSTQFLFTSDNTNCFCYNSGVAPVSQPTSGNASAMCFDNHCSETLKKAFRLTDGECSQYCDTVYNWTNSKQSTDVSQDPSSFDSSTFKRICGNTFNPRSSNTINTSVLISGMIVTLLITHLSFTKSKLLSLTLFIFFGSLTGFLTYDLAGKGLCDLSNRKFICESKLTKLSIPTQFCNYTINCECQFDEDCPGCVCSSGTCIPLSGNRPFHTQVKTIINIPKLTSILTILVLGPFIILKSIHNNIIKWSLVILLIISCLLLVYYISIEKINEKVFDGPCTTCSCNNNETCCNNFCCNGSCINGKCQNYIVGCPLKHSQNIQLNIQSIISGTYTIKYIYSGTEWLLSAENSKSLDSILSVVLRPFSTDFNFTWSYNNETNQIFSTPKNSINTVYLSAIDISDNSTCGNSSENYKGGVSALTQLDKYASKFIISNNTIYSIDANAYIIPDISQTIPNRGYISNVPCITLTYTLDQENASVWIIQP